MNKTSIQWTDDTWNPTTGCDKVSPGCKHCYAEGIAKRFGGEHGFDFQIHRDRFNQPRHMKKGRRIFVNSMSDLFHEQMPEEDLAKVFRVISACPQHTFQILTKRAERLVELAPRLNWHPNIWLGVSIETQAYCYRAELLRKVGASVRFLSCEPLLEPLTLDLSGIDWVIVGGESGPHCRPFNPNWARSIRDQCSSSGVPFFLKQLGGYPNKGGELESIPADLRIRMFPSATTTNPRAPMAQRILCRFN